MKLRPVLCSVLLAMVCTTARAQVAADEALTLQATLPSPWGKPLSPPMAAGTKLRFAPGVMKGPAPLNCPGATHTFLRAPADGLFEGNLPAPAEQSAKAFGMPSGLVTQRIGCSNASFDVHRAADGRAWIGLDNAVLSWSRVSIASSPEATVQTLLVQHFAADLDFSPATVAAQAALLTEALSKQMKSWFERTKGSEEPPELNGDPYTDSQEYPNSFQLGKARITGNRAEVTVMYQGEGRPAYPVHVELVRVNDAWRVSDLRYRDGQKLSQLLNR
ncbi:DUF3828 domain-containing protein [Steroidobacter sp.]|uniref:DUF3828 domain-containing protein n=1 Tax=Steroidobacter sp. TaxID=1978227 RepID=UPI001A5DF6E9|nr:DUF3828 domain-containing protein [Steroidobacter sp.]MBL8271912.1 DUF3828 domain-containing protein [Steroidobacter sp.]